MRQTRRRTIHPAVLQPPTHSSPLSGPCLGWKDTYRRRAEEANQYDCGRPRVEAEDGMTWAVQTTQCPPDSLSQQSKASSHHQSGPNKSLSDRLSKAHIRICYPTRCLPRRRKDGVSGAPGCIPRIPTRWDSPTHKNKASRILTGRLGSAAITRIRADLYRHSSHHTPRPF